MHVLFKTFTTEKNNINYMLMRFEKKSYLAPECEEIILLMMEDIAQNLSGGSQSPVGGSKGTEGTEEEDELEW